MSAPIFRLQGSLSFPLQVLDALLSIWKVQSLK